MRLAEKLNLKKGMKGGVVGKPAGVDLDDVTTTNSNQADAMLVFVTSLAEVDALCDSVVEAPMEDRLVWIAYPKAGQLGTNLNRDILWRHLLKRRIRGVRQIAIDDVWSALRFRREK